MDLGRKKWNVKICDKYPHAKGVVNYLARYLKGGSLGNSRIEKVENGKVTFNVGRGEKVLMTLDIEEFIRRYIQHIPQPRSIRVRSYGLYAHGKKEELELCRKLLGQQPVQLIQKINWQELFEEWDEHPEKCPVCGKRLIVTDSFEAGADISKLNLKTSINGDNENILLLEPDKPDKYKRAA